MVKCYCEMPPICDFPDFDCAVCSIWKCWLDSILMLPCAFTSDRGTTAKSKPWSSASSVPLVCSGPGISRGVTNTQAVSTIDLAPTFLDLAGVLQHAPQNMSSMSLKDVLTTSTTTPMRKFVQFGLDNFRGLVETLNATHTLKFFCCNRQGNAGGCPGSTAADAAGFAADEDEVCDVYQPLRVPISHPPSPSAAPSAPTTD
jgi:hypothetical protein